jgi:hypothetical protein
MINNFRMGTCAKLIFCRTVGRGSAGFFLGFRKWGYYRRGGAAGGTAGLGVLSLRVGAGCREGMPLSPRGPGI